MNAYADSEAPYLPSIPATGPAEAPLGESGLVFRCDVLSDIPEDGLPGGVYALVAFGHFEAALRLAASR
jgi:hypothetical protein